MSKLTDVSAGYENTGSPERKQFKPGEDHMAEANALVNGDRQVDYGLPGDSCAGVAKVWSGLLHNILKRDITPEEVALMLCGLKLRRECARPKRDNLVDAHGYLLVHAHVTQRVSE